MRDKLELIAAVRDGGNSARGVGSGLPFTPLESEECPGGKIPEGMCIIRWSEDVTTYFFMTSQKTTSREINQELEEFYDDMHNNAPVTPYEHRDYRSKSSRFQPGEEKYL